MFGIDDDGAVKFRLVFPEILQGVLNQFGLKLAYFLQFFHFPQHTVLLSVRHEFLWYKILPQSRQEITVPLS
jgi:hypothetical protein